MENEIMNNIVEGVMENNEDIMIEACTNDGFGKGFLGGTVFAAACYGAGKLIAWGIKKAKDKKKAKINIPDDISDDEIDEIPE